MGEQRPSEQPVQRDVREASPVRRIMISSTALDLPEHRQQAQDACQRMSMLPLVMEQMPASRSTSSIARSVARSIRQTS